MAWLSLLDTAILLGLCFSGVALGLVVSLRFLNYPDLTIEGSLPLGGAVGGLVLVHTGSLWAALAAAALAGGAAGLMTACLHVFLGVGRLLSGILMVAALYTVTLRVLGGSNLSLLRTEGTWRQIEAWDRAWADAQGVMLDPLKLSLLIVLVGAVSLGLVAFFHSRPGLAIRSIGDNEGFVAGLGRDPRPYKFFALALGNALAALSGALIGINQGFADVGMGQGALVLGLAGLILGEQSIGRLLGGRRLVPALIASGVVGSVLYQVLLLLSFRAGVTSSDVKLLTAAMILVVMVATGGGSFFYRGRTF